MAVRIYCPKCEWAPGPADRWSCSPGCGYVWNTFETHGKCPGCAKQWEYTQCLACLATSLHDDWYHDEELDEFLRSIEETVRRERELVER